MFGLSPATWGFRTAVEQVLTNLSARCGKLEEEVRERDRALVEMAVKMGEVLGREQAGLAEARGRVLEVLRKRAGGP